MCWFCGGSFEFQWIVWRVLQMRYMVSVSLAKCYRVVVLLEEAFAESPVGTLVNLVHPIPLASFDRCSPGPHKTN